MNIHGVLLLKRLGLPEKFFHFRNISEVSSNVLDELQKEELFVMGSDDRIKITDNPYKIKKWRRVYLSKDKIFLAVEEIHKEMENDGVPLENRIFSLGICFSDSNVLFTGHGFKNNGKIYIDIKKGLRNSGTDFKVDFSCAIPFTSNRILFSQIPDFEFREYIVKLCKDLLIFPEGNPYVDFVLLKDGSFFYHDLSFH